MVDHGDDLVKIEDFVTDVDLEYFYRLDDVPV